MRLPLRQKDVPNGPFCFSDSEEILDPLQIRALGPNRLEFRPSRPLHAIQKR